jgi:DNA-binding transcriptional LysR family regulator
MESIPLPDMDRLATLVAVVEHGSFRKAATARFLSHSTVQKQMRSLERELGFALFERSGRSVVLKPRANELIEAATEAIRACRELQTRIERLRAPGSSALRITAAPIHMVTKLGLAIRYFQQESDIQVERVLRSQEDFLDDAVMTGLLRSSAADVVVSVNSYPGCVTEALWDVELVAIVPLDFAQTIKRGLSVSSLAGMTVFAQDRATWSRRELERLAREARTTLNIVTEPLPEVCVSLARAGLGVAVVASDNVETGSADALTLIDRTRAAVTTAIKASWLPENETPQLRTFLDHLKT